MRGALLAAALLALIDPTTGRAGDGDSEKKIAQLSQQAIDATIKADTTALDAILADDWVGINPDGSLGTKAEHLNVLKDGTLDFVSIVPSEVKVRVYGDAAVLTGRGQSKVIFKGQDVGGPVRTTECYIKQGERWRCVSSQVTRIVLRTGEKP